jgi:peptide/nickel transport system substrate-binding protein
VCLAAWVSAGCTAKSRTDRVSAESRTLRVGVAQLSPTDPIRGLRQLTQNLSVESLVRPGEDGRPQPLLADAWTFADSGRAIRLHLRQGVSFHDGTPLTASSVVDVLPTALSSFMGPVFSDITSITAADDATVEIRFRRPGPFIAEALEAPIRKPGPQVLGTGPYMTAADSTTELRANKTYYLGRPVIDRLVVSNYPSIRSAWAEMLRDRLDMLYEVSSEALESMQDATSISTFTFTRHYQYVVALNAKAKTLQAREVRQALNWAIDRSAVVRDALHGHGIASSQPLAARYWALDPNVAQFHYAPDEAAKLLGKRQLRFTCLVPPDAVSERIALQLKRQLQTAGIDMTLEEATQETVVKRTTDGSYEAALVEFISGPTLFRPYLVWRSGSPLNSGVGNPTFDSALDRVRDAATDTEYRQAVGGLLDAFLQDPPAIFLAWSVRARAVSKRFSVETEAGRDVLATLRMWRPVAPQQRASRN